MEAVNISWSPLPLAETAQKYNVTVKDSNNTMMSSQVFEPYYVFSVSNHVHPCEVYNFSVTATYVGATYTGAGCSEPSPVISRMLPSLPDIGRLESSLVYSLKKQLTKLTLKISFEVCFYESSTCIMLTIIVFLYYRHIASKLL